MSSSDPLPLLLLELINMQCMPHHQAADHDQCNRYRYTYGSATGMNLSHRTAVAFDPVPLRNPLVITCGTAGSSARHRTPRSGTAGSASNE